MNEMTPAGEMTTIANLIAQIDILPEEAVIYAIKPWTMASPACYENNRDTPGSPFTLDNGARYLLEATLIFEVLEGTFGDHWRSQPLNVLCDRVIDYATRDA
jgi:hypothetical protein